MKDEWNPPSLVMAGLGNTNALPTSVGQAGAALGASVGTFTEGPRAVMTVGSSHYRASVTQTELILVAALGSASLTAIASLGVVWLQEWRRGKALSQANLVQAIETVLGKSMAITQRAQVWSTLATAYSGPGDGFAVLLRARQPLNFQTLFEPMIVDQEELSRAAARIWLESDQTIVALVNQVVLLANEVNSVVMPTPPTGWPSRKLGIHVRRWDDADVEKVDQSMKRLGQARKALADRARVVLRQPDIDLFALPDNVPWGSVATPATSALQPEGAER